MRRVRKGVHARLRSVQPVRTGVKYRQPPPNSKRTGLNLSRTALNSKRIPANTPRTKSKLARQSFDVGFRKIGLEPTPELLGLDTSEVRSGQGIIENPHFQGRWNRDVRCSATSLVELHRAKPACGRTKAASAAAQLSSTSRKARCPAGRLKWEAE